jgi:hypothetical protein
LAKDTILNELRTRIKGIDTDRILESSNLEEFIEDSPNSIFPVIEHTERPDKACAAILNGRIVILLDNTPFALIVPLLYGISYIRWAISTERGISGPSSGSSG